MSVASSPPLRILVDLTRPRPAEVSGGGLTELQKIFEGLEDTPNAHLEFVFLGGPATETEVSPLLRPVDRFVFTSAVDWEVAAREKCNLVYCPFGSSDWACPGVPTVVLVPDLLHREFPESLAASACLLREASFQISLKRADLFHVLSDHTLGQLARHYHIEPSRVMRTYCPVPEAPSTFPDPAIRQQSGPYFFYPADAMAHKNHEVLLVAHALYRRAVGTSAWRLVLTGLSESAMQRLKAIAASLNLTEHIDFVGNVDPGRRAALMENAGGLVFPSLYEGSGLSLFDAMARGVAILASNSASIREITGDAALQVPGRAPVALAQAMEQLTSSSDLRRSLAASGRKRIAALAPDFGWGALLRHLRQMATFGTCAKRKGYHPADGFTDPVAAFALPAPSENLTLCFATQALGEARTIEFYHGSDCLTKIVIAAGTAARESFVLPQSMQTLILRVPDATRLNYPVDPRTHGVLLTHMQVEYPDGRAVDLLKPELP